MSKTYYGDVPPAEYHSYQAKNTGVVTGSPKPFHRRSDKTELRAWQQEVARQIRRQINALELNAISENQVCSFDVAFYVKNRPLLPDTDNLLKGFLDPLQHGYGKDGKAHKGAGLLGDDRNIRYISAQTALIDETSPAGGETREEECAKFKYLIIHAFEIINVEKVSGSDYVSYWRSPMQRITAREIIGGQPSGKVSCFIDNMPGIVSWTKWLQESYGYPIPGYDWKKGEVADGCIVSCRANPDHASHPKYGYHPERIKCDDAFFWWLNKRPCL